MAEPNATQGCFESFILNIFRKSFDYCLTNGPSNSLNSAFCMLEVGAVALSIFLGLAYLTLGGALTFAASLVHPFFGIAVALALIIGAAFLISPELGCQSLNGCLICWCNVISGQKGY